MGKAYARELVAHGVGITVGEHNNGGGGGGVLLGKLQSSLGNKPHFAFLGVTTHHTEGAFLGRNGALGGWQQLGGDAQHFMSIGVEHVQQVAGRTMVL